MIIRFEENRAMATIQRRARNGTPYWRVRWRDPEGTEKSRSFAASKQATRFKTEVEKALLDGTYIDADRGQLTMGDWVNKWLAAHGDLTESTRERYRSIIRNQIEPKWGDTPLVKIGYAETQSWLTDLGEDLAPGSIRKAHRVFSQALDFAVKDKRIHRNVAKDVTLPRTKETEQRYLDHVQLEALADECGRQFRPYRWIVLMLGYTGLRWGELAALKVGRLDQMQSRARITESVTPVNGKGLVWGDPKDHEVRNVPVPPWLMAELQPYVVGHHQGNLVFEGERGAVLRVRVFRKAVFDAAVRTVLPGIPGFHPHELRHTAASLAIHAGATVKDVQNMLGHADASMTLNRYTHLFESQTNELSERLAAARQKALGVTPLRAVQ